MYAYEGRVRYSECDETGRLSLVLAINYLQDCSTFQSEELDRGFASLRERGIAWILAGWRIELGELPCLGEPVRVSTWCYEMTRSHARRCFALAGADGRDVVRADSPVAGVRHRRGPRQPRPGRPARLRVPGARAAMAPLERHLPRGG